MFLIGFTDTFDAQVPSKVTYKDNTPLTVATIMLLIVVAIAVVAVVLTAFYIINRRLRGHPMLVTDQGADVELSQHTSMGFT